MKLYKYTTLDAAVKIIENEQIHFARMSDFNDPFEGAFVDSPEDLEGFEADIYPLLLREGITNNFVALSLTRSPFNPLMWAHYGNAYTGCVIEIDIDKTGFNNMNLCTVPADYGDIIYTTSKPNYEEAKKIEMLPRNYESFSPEKYLAVKAAFLNKQTAWSYEEEVRIIKYLNPQSEEKPRHENLAGVWEIKAKPAYQYKNGEDDKKSRFQINHFMNLFSMPRECITRVYVGSKLQRLSVAPSHQSHYKNDPAYNNVNKLKKIKDYGIQIIGTTAMTTTRSIDIHQRNIID